MISEKQYNKILARMESGAEVDMEDRLSLVEIVRQMEDMLEEVGQDDTFGTQGWRYHFGWAK